MKLWQIWVVVLTVILGWLAAALTYLMQWLIGWIFPVMMLPLVVIIWLSASEAQQKLDAADKLTRRQQRELDNLRQAIATSTDDFLNPETLCCQYCGQHSIWYVTRYRFTANIHAPHCRVVELRSRIEPLPLWTPDEFNIEDVLPEWQDNPDLLHHPAFADFFLSPPSPAPTSHA